MFIRDAAAATSREVTPEGFLRVRARIGRAGLHEYRAAELGTPAGFGPTDVVRVYRPPDEVFDAKSMASFRSRPVTDDHPPEMIDAGNWKRYAIGQSGSDVVRDGDHLATDLLISDADGARRALAGAELSNGYFADFIFAKGETPDGEPYDAVQRNIRGNHVALVDASRCGETCRIGDAAAGPCDCKTSADRTAEDLAGAQRRLAELEAEHARALSAKDGEIAALTVRVPDVAVLDALVAERAGVIDAARRSLGPTFDPAGRSTPDIRRLVVAQALGADRAGQQSDAYVVAAFDALAALRPSDNPLARHLAHNRGAATREAALTARNRYLTDAWKRDAASGQQGDS